MKKVGGYGGNVRNVKEKERYRKIGGKGGEELEKEWEEEVEKKID